MALQGNNSLPHDFADKLLELQSLVDDSLSIDLISALSELYRIAIDYYIQFQPYKAQHFQRKMTKLFANPDTLSLIEIGGQKKVNPSRSPKLASKNKINDEVVKFNNCSGEYIKNIIEHSQKVIKKNEALMLNDLRLQQQKLQKRILQKYKSRSILLNEEEIIRNTSMIFNI